MGGKWLLTRKVHLHLYSHSTIQTKTKTGGSGFLFLVKMNGLSLGKINWGDD